MSLQDDITRQIQAQVMAWLDSRFPASALANHIPLFSNTTGKVFIDSGAYINPVNGDIGTPGDIFPRSRTNGLQDRMERLFGADKPANPYYFTARSLLPDNQAANLLGFHTSQASPYALSGPFSWIAPAANYYAGSEQWAHFLTMQNYDPTTNLTLRWTSTTAKGGIAAIIGVSPINDLAAADNLVFEVRAWDVQTPGAGSNYWALRIAFLGATRPQAPLVFGFFSGTGITYALANGTQERIWMPIEPGSLTKYAVYPIAGPQAIFQTTPSEGILGNFGVTAVRAGWPLTFKTVDFTVLPGSNRSVFIDEIYIS